MALLLRGPFRTLACLGGASLPGLALALGLAGAAQAQSHGHVAAYAYPVSDVYGGGFGAPLIQGDYIGAPLTRVPRPSELVPSAWGYGTYGVPTVSGIRSAPVGVPTVYVIDAPRKGGVRAQRRGAHVTSRTRNRSGTLLPDARVAPAAAEQAGGARVITVPVQGRQATLR